MALRSISFSSHRQNLAVAVRAMAQRKSLGILSWWVYTLANPSDEPELDHVAAFVASFAVLYGIGMRRLPRNAGPYPPFFNASLIRSLS